MNVYMGKRSGNDYQQDSGKKGAADQSAFAPSSFVDNRPSASLQRKFQSAAQTGPRSQSTAQLQSVIQKKENKTGLPENLKSGIESLSGMSMEHVKVHYNSPQPAQLNAHAYAQGSDIHISAGQEQYLPHEAWHVVQQAQGRVKPTVQMKEGVPVNDDTGLEHEADVMGAKAIQMVSPHSPLMTSRGQKGVSSEAGINDSAVTQLAPKAPPSALPATPERKADADGSGRGVSSHITENIAGVFAGKGSGVLEYTPGYAWIQNIGKTNYWVNFHLVNELVGGEGLKGNLTPTSKATNSGSKWRQFEETCKKEQSAHPVHVAVEVSYHPAVGGAVSNTRDAYIHFFPNKISARLDSYDSGAWKSVVPTFDAPLNPEKPPADATKQALSSVPNTTLTGLLHISSSVAGDLKKACTEDIPDLENDSLIGKQISGYSANTPEGFYYYLVAWNGDNNNVLKVEALAILKENIFSGQWEI